MNFPLRGARLAAGLLGVVLLTACAGGPRRADVPARVSAVGAGIATIAQSQIGKPYRFGGSGPDAFDCSGLVLFSHAAQGIRVPRTTEEQFRAARPVREKQLAPGDLLFFRFERGRKVSHVGIYTGDGHFVHAPQSGRPVERRRREDPWYKSRLVGTGRLH
jgi:cell wall-associated NlpC family hydrolase